MANGNNISAVIFDGKGGAKEDSIDAFVATKKLSWLHLDYSSTKNKTWLVGQKNIPEYIREALVASETRPRTTIANEGVLFILRAINDDPKAEPEEMISLRLWLEKNKIITATKRMIAPIKELKYLLLKGEGPKTIGEFVDELTDRITLKISEQIDKIDEHIDILEDEVLGKIDYSLRPKLAVQRKQIIALKRYVSPQRDALVRISQVEKFEWLTELDRQHILETGDRTFRCVEDLEEAKDRATVVQETLSSRLSEQVERRMYVLSMVAAIFLPLGFLTGLLGINVGGIPGAQGQWAFGVVSILLVVFAILEYFYFKKKRWI